MVKQTGTDETVMRSSGTKLESCAICAKQVCPFLRFFGSSPKMEIAISSLNKSRAFLCSQQNEYSLQKLPAVGRREFCNNLGQCYPGCTQLAGPGGIASLRI